MGYGLIRDVAIGGILRSNVCSRISSKAHMTRNQIKTISCTISFPSRVNSKWCSNIQLGRMKENQTRTGKTFPENGKHVWECQKKFPGVYRTVIRENRRRWFPWKCRKCANIYICVLYLVFLSIFNFIQNEVLLCFESELFIAQTFSIALYQWRAEKVLLWRVRYFAKHDGLCCDVTNKDSSSHNGSTLDRVFTTFKHRFLTKTGPEIELKTKNKNKKLSLTFVLKSYRQDMWCLVGAGSPIHAKPRSVVILVNLLQTKSWCFEVTYR